MIICGGENLMDLIELPGAQGARSFTAHVGGSPYNCSRAIARLGGVGGYLGTLSTDSFGDQLHNALMVDGALHLGQRSQAPTTLAVVTVEDGKPDYRFYRDGTAERQINLETLRADLPDTAVALHVGSIALIDGPDADAWQETFREAARAGLFTSLDPNVRALIADANRAGYVARLDAMATEACLIKLSDEDAVWWFPDLAPEEALSRLAGIAPQAVLILTQGPREVLCRWAGGNFRCHPSPPRSLIDTVGAGDTLMAAILVGLARMGALSPAGLGNLGADQLQTLVADATRAAAITCSRTGCNPPTAQELWGES
jgi:fructokinase